MGVCSVSMSVYLHVLRVTAVTVLSDIWCMTVGVFGSFCIKVINMNAHYSIQYGFPKKAKVHIYTNCWRSTPCLKL